MEKVIVQVPASTSNLGPGFDCLGVALALHNSIILRRERPPGDLPEIADAAARLFFNHTGVRPFAFSAAIDDKVPRSRGLGSSATARVGVVCGLNELCRRPLDRMGVFQLAARLEGHPDNVAPACFGGFTVVRAKRSKERFGVQRFEVGPKLFFVLLVPDHEVATSKARKVLPASVSRVHAVENSANACAITAAFATRDYGELRGMFVDRLHQPFRTKLNALLPRVVAAAERAGALGAFLSGSGSTICALTLENVKRVAAAMQRAAAPGVAQVIITRADNRGIRIRHSQRALRNS